MESCVRRRTRLHFRFWPLCTAARAERDGPAGTAALFDAVPTTVLGVDSLLRPTARAGMSSVGRAILDCGKQPAQPSRASGSQLPLVRTARLTKLRAGLPDFLAGSRCGQPWPASRAVSAGAR